MLYLLTLNMIWKNSDLQLTMEALYYFTSPRSSICTLATP